MTKSLYRNIKMLWGKSSWWKNICLLVSLHFFQHPADITNTHIFIYLPLSVTSSNWFILRRWKYIIIDFVFIMQKIIYTLSSCCMNIIITVIILNHNLPIPIILFDVFNHMCLNTFCVESKTILYTMKHMLVLVL